MSEEKKDIEVTEEVVEETPAVEEKQDDASTESMSEALMFAEEIKPGDLVEGEVLAIDEDKNVVVGLSTGQEGVVPLRELANHRVEDPADEVEVGENIEVVVLRSIADKEQGSFVLSKKRIDQRKIWEELEEKFENDETIEATVNRVVKGGVTVDLGIRGFVPASQLATHFVRDLDQFKDNTYEFKILEINPRERQLILSRRAIVEVEEAEKRAEAMANLEEGAIVKGEVVRLTNFGAFVDLGGVDGLVHISEISHEHVNKTSDKLSVGEEVDVKVLKIDEERGRISLSIKDTLPGPWENVDEEFPAGSTVKGIVKRIVDFGVFVELKPGVEGLVHISEIAHRHVETPHEVVSAGDEIDVKVLNIDPENERVSLSIKALEEAPKNEGGSQKGRERSGRGRQRAQVKQPSLRDDSEETAFTLGDQIGSQLSDLLNQSEDE